MLTLARTSVLVLLVLAVVCTTPATRAEDPKPAEPAKADEEQAVETVVEEIVLPQVIIKSQVAPDYPPAALAARFEGVVVLELNVLKDGTVGDSKVVKCSHPNIGFEQAAIEATKKWRFEAALKEGEPIDYASTFRVNFRVAGGGQPFVSWGAAGVDPTSTTSSSTVIRQPASAGGRTPK
jgi:TonB family protein